MLDAGGRRRKLAAAATTLAACALAATFSAVGQGATSIAERIRAAEISAPGIPMNPDLYASEITYQHGNGPAHTIPRDAFLSRIGKEQSAFAAFVSGDAPKLSAFTEGTRDIVAVTERKGSLPNGTQIDISTSIAFTVADGRIKKIVLNSSPELGPQFAEWFRAQGDGRRN